MAEFNLKVASFCDAHLILSVLYVMREQGLADPILLTRSRIKCMESTNMLDAIEEELSELPESDPLRQTYESQGAEVREERRNELLRLLEEADEMLEPLTTYFQDEEVFAAAAKDKEPLTPERVAATVGVPVEMIDRYYGAAKLKYDCGIYDEAGEMLDHYLQLSHPQSSSKVLAAKWGRLALHILELKWEDAAHAVMSLKDEIDRRSWSNSQEQLQQRTWLLHWSVFVFFNNPKDGGDQLVELFTSHLTTIENNCPWLLRYLVVAVIVSRSRRNKASSAGSLYGSQVSTRALVLEEVRLLNYVFTDPFCKFFELLFDEFDFTAAHECLTKECSPIIMSDVHLYAHHDRIMTEAKKLIFETYAQLHHKVNIDKLAAQLGLSGEEAEKCMVDMVRSYVFEASIDSAQNTAVVRPLQSNAFQKVADRAADLTHRTQVLGSNMEKLMHDQRDYIRLIAQQQAGQL